MGGKLQVVVGGQYGSEGKGAVAGYLAARETDLMAIRVAGPNAGHCVVDEDGVKHKLRSLPVAAVTNPRAQLRIAAGSEVDFGVLSAEMSDLADAGHGTHSRLKIDDQATVLEDRHRFIEEHSDIQSRLGSTAKGIGAARSDRIWRRAHTVNSFYERGRPAGGSPFGDVAAEARGWLYDGGTVQVEGAQGYGLGLHAGEYPYCTSSDCRAVDFLAMAGLSTWADCVEELEIWVVARAFPIRVAGNSGPLKGETSWSNLDLPEERTTVTNKVRRVGEWDGDLMRRALVANGAPSPHVRVALTMMDHLIPGLAGKSDWDNSWPQEEEAVNLAVRGMGFFDLSAVDLLGTGPSTMLECLI